MNGHTRNPFNNLTNTGNNMLQPSQDITIMPIVNGIPPKKQPQLNAQRPELTFHCMFCSAYSAYPSVMYRHLNDVHPNRSQVPEEPQNSVNTDESENVFEPICELVELDEKVDGIESETDSESDEESSTCSSGTSTTTGSSGTNSNAPDELVTSANIKVNGKENMYLANYGNVGGIYEEVETDTMSSGSTPDVPTIIKNNQRESISITMVDSKSATTHITSSNYSRTSSAVNTGSVTIAFADRKCFQCSQCEQSFRNAGDLSKHVRSHITNKPYQCSICEKTFTHIGSLNTHIRIHTGDKPYQCQLCSKSFTQSSSLMVHLRSHNSNKPFHCELCDKGFFNNAALIMHQKTHEGEVTYSCEKCDKVFKQQSVLDEHMLLHTEISIFQCAICKISFTTASLLVQHMKCHTGAKPFTCSLCERSFTQPGSLNIHMRIHTGEKPFKCKYCNKSFAQTSSLSVHMKGHTGYITFPCHICGKNYSQQAYLNKHMQGHVARNETHSVPQPKTPLVCIVCSKTFADISSFELHVATNHEDLLKGKATLGNRGVDMIMEPIVNKIIADDNQMLSKNIESTKSTTNEISDSIKTRAQKSNSGKENVEAKGVIVPKIVHTAKDGKVQNSGNEDKFPKPAAVDKPIKTEKSVIVRNPAALKSKASIENQDTVIFQKPQAKARFQPNEIVPPDAVTANFIVEKKAQNDSVMQLGDLDDFEEDEEETIEMDSADNYNAQLVAAQMISSVENSQIKVEQEEYPPFACENSPVYDEFLNSEPHIKIENDDMSDYYTFDEVQNMDYDSVAAEEEVITSK
ncbi:zinc finger protein 2 [Teleopsis dalmanni]|uniref:zinc finger protein 2 n=1 Tax=Teleopsis dalmanni TaxID=139649 RepID=UPI000D32B97F|nr:zinc finger protein 2 [Teleopsis dalmanni]XP_037957556.1 zinc finger protein 2 [Teleopsis dalmanni]XP_037957557.1 zinc finger protein 2 [Teleopsis dalmanni]